MLGNAARFHCRGDFAPFRPAECPSGTFYTDGIRTGASSTPREGCDRGLRQADVIDRSVHRLPLYEKMKTVKIETSNLNVQQTARQILHLLNKNKCGGSAGSK